MMKALNEVKNAYERRSYKLIILSAAMMFVGLLVGPFVSYVLYLATFGSVLFTAALALYIYSQIVETKAEEKA